MTGIFMCILTQGQLNSSLQFVLLSVYKTHQVDQLLSAQLKFDDIQVNSILQGTSGQWSCGWWVVQNQHKGVTQGDIHCMPNQVLA